MKTTNKLKLLFGILILISLVSCILFIILLAIFKPGYFSMDGGSMEPNLIDGSTFITLNKTPKREDIIVFETKSGPALAKRVVGLPGEKVMIKDGLVYIDGDVYDEDYLEADEATNSGTYIEEGVELIVPENSYFVLGDNRSTSKDSRSSGIGFVQKDEIKGVFWVEL